MTKLFALLQHIQSRCGLPHGQRKKSAIFCDSAAGVIKHMMSSQSFTFCIKQAAYHSQGFVSRKLQILHTTFVQMIRRYRLRQADISRMLVGKVEADSTWCVSTN